MPKVHFLNEYLTVDVTEGSPLLDVAEQHGVMIYRGMWPNWNCGGRGICGRCKVWIPDSSSVSPPSGPERVRRIKGEQRMSCQVEILGDTEVRTRPVGPALEDLQGDVAALGEAGYKKTAAVKLEEATAEEEKKAALLAKKKAAAAKKKAEEEAEAKKAEEEAEAKKAEEEAEAKKAEAKKAEAKKAEEEAEAKKAEAKKAEEEAEAKKAEEEAEEGAEAKVEEKPEAKVARPATQKKALEEEEGGWDIDEESLKPPS